MQRCRVTTEQLLSNSIALDKAQSHHLRTVLRIKLGEPLELFDGLGHTCAAMVAGVEKNAISINPCGTPLTRSAPACAITLFACISKGRRMDWTVEKATELGVARIVPVISSRTIVRLSPTEGESKSERWRRVAEDAARQCGTAWIPEVSAPLAFSQALELLANCAPVFTAALTQEAVPLRDAIRQYPKVPAAAGWLVGPEGDFTADELHQLRQCQTNFVSLGSNILRAETASLYGLCALSCAWL